MNKEYLNKILVWIALSSIFTSGLYVKTNYGILFFHYYLMLPVYVLASVRSGSIGFQKAYGVFFFILIGVSCLGFLISAATYDIRFVQFAAFIAKSIMLLFFIMFFTVAYNLCGKSARLFFKRYLEVASAFAVLGVLQEIIFMASGIDFLSHLTNGAKHYGSYLGIAGLSVEPAFYACSLLPAGAYYVSNFARTLKIGPSAVTVIGAILLSTSSLGYLGLFISAALTIVVCIKPRQIWMLFIVLPLFVFGAYQASKLHFFHMRTNDTLSVLAGADITMSTGMNISTYSLAVNMSMSMRSFQNSYGVGAGFGAYSVVYDHYINDYEMPGYRDDLPGRGSATSLFARLTAELGATAWLFFLTFFLWSWSDIRRSDIPSVNIAYAASLVIILLRMGEYYANGIILVFLMIYWLHFDGRRRSVAPLKSAHT